MRTAIALSLAAAFAFPACGGLDTFDVDVQGTAQIPGSPLSGIISGPLEIPGLTTFKFADVKEFKDNDVDPSDVDSVKLTKLTFTVTAPQDGNLDFLDEVDVYAEAPGLPKVKIAEKHPVPDGVQKVSLKMTGVQLKKYVSADEMKITTEVVGRAPKSDTTLRAKATFEIDAAIL